LTRVVDFLIGEPLVVAAILVNTTAIFVLGFVDIGSDTARVCLIVEFICVLYFLLEAYLKSRSWGWSTYWAGGWNRFDFIVVACSLPALTSPFLELELLAWTPILRVGRLFRLFRLMRFIPNRDHLMAGVARALRASIGVFFALVLIDLVLALGATMLFGPYAPEYFGDPLLSLYSMFKVFTVEGWYEVPDLLSERGDPALGWLARMYFVVSVLVGGILGLSLANAVFVDEMTMDNTAKLERRVEDLHLEVRGLREQLAALLPLEPGTAPGIKEEP
jgi:voltage-gated sodium channel